MMRSAGAMAAVALVSVVAIGCRSGSGGGGSAGPRAHAAECPARALALSPGSAVVPMTGEHAVTYRLTNRGQHSCWVHGYPRVALYSAAGKVLPFRYAAGGGAYVTASKPVTVVLARGAWAYILVAKYRCDLGIARDATSIWLTVPAAHGTSFSRREPVGISGPPGLSYCLGGRHDPGQLVTVSPLEPTLLAASRLR
jgi:Domain of unknown function (DUF4232)